MDVSKLVDIKLLGKENWVDWKADILTLLRHKEVVGVIDGTMKKPDPLTLPSTEAQDIKYQDDLKTFTKADTCAILIIRSSLSPDVRPLVRMCPDDAKSIWKELCNNFEKKSDVRFCKLNQDFYRAHSLPSESLLLFVARIRTLWAELQKEFEAEQNVKLPEILLINKILSELPEEYSEFQTTCYGTPKAERTVEELINRLELRESRSRSFEEESVLMNKISSRKEARSKKSLDSRDRNSRNNSNNFQYKCYKCNKYAGHMARNCTEQTEDGTGRKTKTLLSFIASVSKTTKEDIWIKDDGATDHMTNSSQFFKKYKSFDKPVSITVGDGSSKLCAYGRGDIDMESKVNGKVNFLTFANVLYVPGLIRNCFSSVKAMSRGISHVGDSKRMKATFYSEDDGEVLMEGYVKEGHFELQVSPISPTQHLKACVAEKNSGNQIKSLEHWHKILCHQGKNYVKQFLNQKNIKFKNEDFFCEACIYGKIKRRSFNSRSVRAQSAGEIIHADLCEPEQASMGGNKYFLVLKDDYSRFRQVYLLKNKSDTGDKIRNFILRAERNGVNIREILTDGGREFNNQSVKHFLEQRGINLRIVMPYTHEQNGAAERENRILVEMARTMLKSVDLPKALWGEAVSTAAYVLNLTGKSSEQGKSPFEVWFSKEPSIKNLREFGSTSYVHVPGPKRKKFDSKSIKGILVGYSGYDGYRIFIPAKKEVIISTNVIFNENDGLFSRRPYSEESLEKHKDSSRNLEESSSKKEKQIRKNKGGPKVQSSYSWFDEVEETSNNNTGAQGSNTTYNDDVAELPVDEIEELPIVEEEEFPTDEEEEFPTHEEEEFPTHEKEIVRTGRETETGRVLRPRENLKAPDRYQASIEKGRVLRPRENLKAPDWYQASMIMTTDINEPLSYSEAMKSPNNAQWQEAMKAEITSLEKNKTWKLVNLPKEKKAINSRWVYKVKTHADGSIERFKARLVAKGYTQVAGVDYCETFSPVVRYDSVRALLALAAAEGLHLAQLDVETAFLHGDLEEEIYMRQPEGCNDGSGRVCKLVKSLYGLKQAPRCWNKKFSDFLLSYGLIESHADPCLFIRSKPGHRLIIGVYVDDGVVAAEDESDIETFLKDLSDRFKIRHGPLKHYLGMEIEQSNGCIFIHQKNYAERLVAKFHQESCKPVNVPITKGQLNVNREESKDLNPDQRSLYRAAVGSLLYLAVCTRPDVSYAVSVASQNLENPKTSDWVNVKRILRYLKGTSNLGILYSKNKTEGLAVYSDADYAGCNETRKSQTGVVAFYNNTPVSWFSKKQVSIALSTTEAEYMAASEAAKEALWLKRLYREMNGYEGVPQLLIDNQSCIQYVKNQNFHMRTKHIDVRYKFIREKFNEGLLDLKYVPSEEQRADVLTKPLENIKFQQFKQLLGLSQLEDFKGGC